MRYYLISLIALSVEKKGVDAVRRVSVLKSVTVSVTIRLQWFINNKEFYCEVKNGFSSFFIVVFQAAWEPVKISLSI